MSNFKKLLQEGKVMYQLVLDIEQHSVRNVTPGKKTKSRSNCIPLGMHRSVKTS
jgi:hypothetical protein